MCICSAMELIIVSCIQGYHVYREIWTAVLGKELFCECKAEMMAAGEILCDSDPVGLGREQD